MCRETERAPQPVRWSRRRAYDGDGRSPDSRLKRLAETFPGSLPVVSIDMACRLQLRAQRRILTGFPFHPHYTGTVCGRYGQEPAEVSIPGVLRGESH